MVLVFDTAGEEAFVGLWDKKWLHHEHFVGGRDLNKLIIQKLETVISETTEELVTGVIVNSGPGSFTGLRIGLSVANTVAFTYDVPIVGIKNEADIEKLLQKGKSVLESRGVSFEGAVTPHYGAEPHITIPKKG